MDNSSAGTKPSTSSRSKKTVNAGLLKKKLGKLSSKLSANKVNSTVGGKVSKDKLQKPKIKNAVQKASFETLKSRLNSSRFRYLNEMLYTTQSEETFKKFKKNPEDFHVYHEGFQNQVSKWPVNPIDHIIEEIKKSPNGWVVGDFGCGEARLAKSVPNKVYSFDFVAVNDQVISCDMANLPLSNATLDVGVFCLSLMGVNISDFIKEANRVLKMGAFLYVAEVESRFSDRQSKFSLEAFGFEVVWKKSYEFFFIAKYKKTRGIGNKSSLPNLKLKPCVYKKR